MLMAFTIEELDMASQACSMAAERLGDGNVAEALVRLSKRFDNAKERLLETSAIAANLGYSNDGKGID